MLSIAMTAFLCYSSAMVDEETDDKLQRITLRIPRELHARLLAQASARTRSMNAEVVARLESSFEEQAPNGPNLFVTVFAGSVTEIFRRNIKLAHKSLQSGDRDRAIELLSSLGDTDVSETDEPIRLEPKLENAKEKGG